MMANSVSFHFKTQRPHPNELFLNPSIDELKQFAALRVMKDFQKNLPVEDQQPVLTENERLAAIMKERQEFENRKKIELKNLPGDICADDVAGLLDQFHVGPIHLEKVETCTNATVLLGSGQEAQTAIQEYHGHHYQGNVLSVSMASVDSLLCITNLPLSFTQENVRKLCEAYGPVDRCFVMPSEETGNSKGYAFVEYPSKDIARKAKTQLNGRMVQTHEINCDWTDENHCHWNKLHSTCLLAELGPDFNDTTKFRSLFNKIADPRYIQLALNSETRKCLGFGIVAFENPIVTEQTWYKVNGANVYGQTLRVYFVCPGHSGRNEYSRRLTKCSKKTPQAVLGNPLIQSAPSLQLGGLLSNPFLMAKIPGHPGASMNGLQQNPLGGAAGLAALTAQHQAASASQGVNSALGASNANSMVASSYLNQLANQIKSNQILSSLGVQCSAAAKTSPDSSSQQQQARPAAAAGQFGVNQQAQQQGGGTNAVDTQTLLATALANKEKLNSMIGGGAAGPSAAAAAAAAAASQAQSSSIAQNTAAATSLMQQNAQMKALGASAGLMMQGSAGAGGFAGGLGGFDPSQFGDQSGSGHHLLAMMAAAQQQQQQQQHSLQYSLGGMDLMRLQQAQLQQQQQQQYLAQLGAAGMDPNMLFYSGGGLQAGSLMQAGLFDQSYDPATAYLEKQRAAAAATEQILGGSGGGQSAQAAAAAALLSQLHNPAAAMYYPPSGYQMYAPQPGTPLQPADQFGILASAGGGTGMHTVQKEPNLLKRPLDPGSDWQHEPLQKQQKF